MLKTNSISKRALAMLLTLAMILPVFASSFTFGVAAYQQDGSHVTITDGEIVADNYDLTAEEEKLLKSGYLIGSTNNYTVPGASHNLISVDIENKVIEMQTVQGGDGTVWSPVSAQIKVGNQVVQEFSNITGNKVNYTYEGSAFAVYVQYEGKNNISADNQELLLNASDILKSGIDNLEAILDPDGDIQKALKTFSTISMQSAPFADSEGMGVFEYLYKKGIYIDWVDRTFTFGESEIPAAEELWNQLDNNEGVLNLQKLAAEYAEASSKVKFLIENAEAIKNEMANTRECLLALNSSQGLIARAYSLSGLSTLGDYINSMTTLAGNNSETGLLDAYTEDSAWKILPLSENNPVKDGLNDTQYSALDILVTALKDDIKGASATVVNPVVVASTEIEYAMNVYTVNIQIVLNTVNNSNVVAPHDTKTYSLAFAQNATANEIQSVINGTTFESEALASWAGVYVDGQFDRTVSNLPATLTGDIDYTITYTPKNYSVNFLGTANEYPYGYKFLLPLYDEDDAYAYNYDVDGDSYYQGSIITITGPINSITRELSKAYTSFNVIEDLVVNNFFPGSDDGSKKAVAILTSGAVKTEWVGQTVNVRLPEDIGLITLDGNKLTVGTYPSGYNGLIWVPYSYKANNQNEAKLFGNSREETISDGFDSVSVEYRLEFTNLTGGISDLLGLLNTLVAEADSQLEALEALNGYYGQMGLINEYAVYFSYFTPLIIAKGDTDGDGVIDDPDCIELNEAITGFSRDCISGGSFKLYNYMTRYRAEKLLYYYKNYEEFTSEIDLLYDYLEVIGEHKELMKEIIDEAAILPAEIVNKSKEAIDNIDLIKITIRDYRSKLTAPHNSIDLDSPDLINLTTALEADKVIPSVDADNHMHISHSFIKYASNKVSATVTLPDSTLVETPAFDKDHVLTANDIKEIIKSIENALPTDKYPAKYYDCSFDSTVFNKYIGEEAKVLTNADAKVDITYTLKKFIVSIEDADGAVISTHTIDFDNKKVILPESTSSAYRYEYIVLGKVLDKNITFYDFSIDELNWIIENGCVITRNVIDIQREECVEIVNNLNDAINSDLIVFALLEKNGEYSIVMKMDASNPTAMQSAVMGMVQVLIGYGYVAFDGNAMIANNQISIQALINAILDSGFGSDDFIGMMDSKGNIKNDTSISGNVISDKSMNKFGATVAETTLKLGNSENDITYELPMSITIGAVSPELVELRNLYAEQLANYFKFEFVGGEVALGITLPQKAYEAYLAVLLATDNADITNLETINNHVAFGFLKDLIDPIMTSNASTKSIENTLAKFGYNYDLSKYERGFELLRKFYNENVKFGNARSTSYNMAVEMSIDSYIDGMNLGPIGDMIAEKGTGIRVPISASLTNLEGDFEALYFDINADGITNKFGLVKDLSAKLPSISGTAFVILLDDVKDSLTFKTTTILNLNGHDVQGNITGNGKVVIVDSNINYSNTATVSGKVSGNVTITGGKYTSNVSAYVPEGYVQGADGVVSNVFFNVVSDSNGDVTVELNAGALSHGLTLDPKSLAVDIATELLLNGFTVNSLYFDGEKVFDLTTSDIISIYTAADRKAALLEKFSDYADLGALNTILNNVLDDVLDFDALSTKLNNNEPILSYDVTTGAWGIEFEYIEKDDSISIGITSDNVDTNKLHFAIVGNEADKQRIATVLDLLADTTEVDVNVNVSLGTNNGNVVVGIAADGKFEMDLSHNSQYAVVLSVIVANGLSSSARKDLVAGLEDYFKTDDMTALEKAFNKLTVNDIITAVKKFNADNTYKAMLANIGLSKYYDAKASALEEKFGDIGTLLSAILRKLEIDGPKVAIGNAFDAASDAYTFSKENITKSVTESRVTVNVEITSLFASVKLFGEGGGGSDGPDGPGPDVPGPDEPGPGGDPVVVIDYSKLEAEIAKIEAENLVEADYTEDSWAVLEAALIAGKKLVETKSATSQKQVDDTLEILKAARAGLKKKSVTPEPDPEVDYRELKAAIAEAEALNKNEYTSDSWDVLEAALAAARLALTSKDQTVVNNATKVLKNAISSLVKVDTHDNDWIIVLVVALILVLAAAGGVVFFKMRRKKNLTDSTPMVKYDINDDNDKK